MTTATTATDQLADELHDALTREASAWQAVEEAKLRCLGVEAQASTEIRQTAVTNGKKPTEAELAAWVTLAPAVVDARLEAIEIEAGYRRARADVAYVECQVSLRKAECYRQGGIQR